MEILAFSSGMLLAYMVSKLIEKNFDAKQVISMLEKSEQSEQRLSSTWDGKVYSINFDGKPLLAYTVDLDGNEEDNQQDDGNNGDY